MASLNVIGLVSGGKDSFFSLLHCMVHGHRVVALANLHPPELAGRGTDEEAGVGEDEEDLNSFMYQTVGHEVVPLYAAATGLPLYRQPIVGGAVQSGRDYEAADANAGADATADADETESMTALLRRVLAAHPEANAVCAGALLSTYQRTRVESVAVRLGLVSLAYLWKFPVLPAAAAPGALPSSDDGYLADLAAAGFDARIIKVASGGLDESLLWTNVASPAGRARLRRALARLGLAGGANSGSMLGEGGEYETLVVDGPRALFRAGSIAVAEADRRVVQEGGGTAWLHIRKATVVPKDNGDGGDDRAHVRQPDLFDPRFADVLALLKKGAGTGRDADADTDADTALPSLANLALTTAEAILPPKTTRPPLLTTWRVVPNRPASPSSSIADATQSIVDQVRQRLAAEGLLSAASPSPTHSVVRTLVVLRRMADFPAFNAVYGTLFHGAPNPPARVTIACGAQLPAGVDVAVFLGVLARRRDGESSPHARQGLHVQSRSYWAPANIGPYSQAVSVPAARLFSVATSNSDDGPRIVSIAGQIPLVPATMELPDQAVEEEAAGVGGGQVKRSSTTPTTSPPLPASFAFQTALALQHLWRIGVDLDVQWWSSAVAYVPRQEQEEEEERVSASASPSLQEKAVLVAQAWRAAHAWRPRTDSDADDEDEDEEGEADGPDLWDRKFDARYAMYGDGGGDDDAAAPRLPDWGVLKERGPDAIPPVFLAEVQELPRSVPVEWHAQAGFSHVRAGQSSIIQRRTSDDERAQTRTYQTVLQMAPPSDDDDGEDSDEDNNGEGRRPKIRSSQIVSQTVRPWAYPAGADTTVPGDALFGNSTDVPDVVYADMRVCRIPERLEEALPIVPCASLWSERGDRLAAVVVRTAVYEEAI